MASTELRAFVMMPFATEFDDVFDVIKQCIGSVDEHLQTIRLDELRAAGQIGDDLVKEIERSTLCIADVTGSNANVMWEVGFCRSTTKAYSSY